MRFLIAFFSSQKQVLCRLPSIYLVLFRKKWKYQLSYCIKLLHDINQVLVVYVSSEKQSKVNHRSFKETSSVMFVQADNKEEDSMNSF